jgi:hypothetical protein
MAGVRWRSILAAAVAFAVCLGLTAVLAAPLGPRHSRGAYQSGIAPEAIRDYDSTVRAPTALTSASRRTIYSYDRLAQRSQLSTVAIWDRLAAEGVAAAGRLAGVRTTLATLHDIGARNIAQRVIARLEQLGYEHPTAVRRVQEAIRLYQQHGAAATQAIKDLARTLGLR